MNAATMPYPTRRNAFAGAWSLFWRSATPTTRGLVIGSALMLAALNMANAAVPVLYLGTLLLWWLWVPRLALMQREAHQTRMPSMSRETLVSLLLATLPAFAFAFSGDGGKAHDGAWWLAAMVSTAAVGVIGSFLSLRTLGVLFFVHPWPFIAVYWMSKNGALPANSLDIMVRGALGTDLRIGLVAAALCAIAAMLWRRFVRMETASFSWYRTPLILFSNDRKVGGAMLTQGNGILVATDPLTQWLMRETRRFGPESPALAIRRLIGPPFAPQTKRQIVFSTVSCLMLPFLFVSNGLVGVIAGKTVADAMSIGAIAGGGGVLLLSYLLFPYRIRQLMRRPAAELSELALLPGLGDAAAARSSLLRGMRSVLGVALCQLAAVVLVGVLFAWNVDGVSPQRWTLYALLFAQVVGFVVTISLCWLAGGRFRPEMEALLWLGGIALPVGTMLWFRGEGRLAWPELTVAGIATLGLGLAAVNALLRKFRDRPHPFLQA